VITRSDRVVVHLVVAGVLLAGLGLLYEIVAEPGAPATTVHGDVNPPQRARQLPPPVEAPEFTKAASDEPRSRGYVSRAKALPPARPVTTDPDRIVVPALSVDAPVVPISTQGGVLVPPGDPTVIGWWSAGARPGATTGTAVLTGHTVSTGGGAFDDLDLMTPGQRLRIESGAVTTRYVVRSVRVYRKQSLADHAARIFDQDVPGRVALVTCEEWNGHVYLSNAVVIADPVHS